MPPVDISERGHKDVDVVLLLKIALHDQTIFSLQLAKANTNGINCDKILANTRFLAGLGYSIYMYVFVHLSFKS